MERENLGTAHVDLSHTYYVLGGILDDLGENNEATECYEACLNIEIENWGNDDIDLIPTYNALGKSLYWQGEYAAAWKNFSSALALSSTDTTEHPDELDESRRYIATITSIQRTSD